MIVLFWDIDGTLLTTAKAGVFAWNEAVRELTGRDFEPPHTSGGYEGARETRSRKQFLNRPTPVAVPPPGCFTSSWNPKHVPVEHRTPLT